MNKNMKIELLTESDEFGYRLSGPFCAAERMNRNGRIYTASDLKRETLKLKEKVDNGEEVYLYLDHPDHIDLIKEDSCAVFESIEWNDTEQFGECSVKTLVDTKDGKKVNEDLKTNIGYGISTRGLGSVNKKTKIVEDYQMITADLIRNENGENQSCQICTLQTLHESKDSLTEQEINSLDDFLVEKKVDEKSDDCGCPFEKMDESERKIVENKIKQTFTNIWSK